MVGGLIKIAAQMAAWGASVSATAGAAKWASSRIRQAVASYGKHADASTRAATKFAIKAIRSITGKETASAQASHIFKIHEFAKHKIQSSLSNFSRRFNRIGQENLRAFRTAGSVEICALPMNYTMYRIDKHRAVTPEEREATQSFRKYYMGTPMVVSMATGVAFTRMQGTGKIRSASTRIAKKLSPTTRRAVRDIGLVTLHAARNVTERMSAMRRAQFRTTEGRAIMSVIGTMGPMETAGRIWRQYRKEMSASAQGGYNSLVMKILKDEQALSETYARRAARMRKRGGNVAEIDAFEKQAIQNVINITEKRLTAYTEKATTGNKFLSFFSNLSTQLHDPTFAMRNEFMTITKDMSKAFAGRKVPTGRYIMGGGNGLIVDFGRLSLTNIKNAVLSGTTKGLSGNFLHLFGIRDILQAKDAEHSLIGAVTITKREPLNMPMAYFDDSGEATPKDVMAQMMGFKDFTDASNANRGADVEDFLQTRLDAMSKEYGIHQTETANLNAAFMRSARHGELWFNSGDILVQHPGGKVEIITHAKRTMEGDSHPLIKPIRVEIGGYAGETLNFLKFTRESDSIPAKLIRSHTGYEEATYKTSKGRVSVVHGPGKYGKVMDPVTSEGTQSLWTRLRQYLDLGYQQEQAFFSRITNIFRKHTDPRYPTTFFSRDYVQSKDFRQEILKTGRSKSDLLDFFREQADDAMLEYWYGATRRMDGTDNVVKVFKALASKTKDYFVASVADPLITPDMSVRQAKEKVDSFIAQLTALGEEGGTRMGDLATHFLERDLDSLKEFRRLFTAPSDKTVLDTVGHIASRRSTFFGARPVTPNKLDEYNAMALRINIGVIQSGDLGQRVSAVEPLIRKIGSFPKMLTDSERSAWYAASHLSKIHHGLASRIAEATVLSGDEAINGVHSNIDSILASVSNVEGTAYKDITAYYKKRWRFAPWSMWDYDSRLKWGDTQNVKTGIYLIPQMSGKGMVSKEPLDLGPNQRVQIAKGVMDASNISVMSLFHAFNRAASEFTGMGFDETTLSTPFQYFEKMFYQRVLPFTAAYLGYATIDRIVDRTMDGTPFGEGITTFGANILAGARVSAQGFLDTVGATDLASYMEDLMPGVITSPMSGAIRGAGPIALGMSLGMKAMGPRGALTGGAIGSAVGLLTGGGPLGVFGLWDISKSRKETVQELLGEKEVAVRKGRWWELSGSPFEGTRIQYFRPHIYSLLRSDYKETPGFKDSLFTEMVGHLAPDWYAMKNYYSRPYPVTSGLFSNLPVFGNMFDMLTSLTPITRLATMRGIAMHDGEFSPTYMQRLGEEAGYSPEQVSRNFVTRSGFFSTTEGSSGTSPMSTLAGAYTERSPVQPGYDYNYTEQPMMRSSFEWGLGETADNVKDIVGLRGFLMGSTFESMTGRKGLFDYAPELAAPADIPGIQREYWDYELGGILGFSEVLRRYLPHRRNQIELFNPIRNTMPDWLPGHNYYVDLQHGDPYTAVPMGEARLPGAAYETLHDVSLTMPVVADILGEATDSQIAYYLGLPDYMSARNRDMDVAKVIAINYIEDAKRYGELVGDKRIAYNAQYDISATADAVLKGDRGQWKPVKIVPKGFGGESNLNAFLVLSDMESGILIEVDPKTGGMTEKLVRKDVKRFSKELQRNTKARAAAYNQVVQMERDGRAYNLANAYSWFDRYRILADVAIYSKEFKQASNIVKQQIKGGMLPAERIAEFEMIEEQVDRKKKAYEFQEYRFSDLGEGLTPYTRARDTFVTEQYNMLERTIGRVWERVGHLRNPLQVKFYHNMDALEEYEHNSVYGKTIKMWENPVEDYLKSYAYSAMGEQDPAQGALSWATAGFLVGGAPLSGLAAGMGAAVSGINWLTDNNFIPDRVQNVREITSQGDALKYVKYRRLYEQTGDPDMLRWANRTLTGAATNGDVLGPGDLAKSMGRPERDYIEDIINNVTMSNVGRVTQILPQPAVASVYKAIGYDDTAQGIMGEYAERQMNRMVPSLDSAVYSREVPIEAPMITTMEQAGLNTHDAGYGWYSQMAQINRLTSMGVYHGEGIYGYESRASVRNFTASLSESQALRQLLAQFGTNVEVLEDGQDRVEVEIISRGL